MASSVRLLTAEDIERLPRDKRGELIDGVFIEVPPANAQHGHIAVRIAVLLDSFARPRGLGSVSTEVGFILRRNPDLLRGPDVALVRAERVPPGGPPATFWALAPDLAVEVISPEDRPAEIQAKVREYLEAGTRLVWLVYPATRTVVVIRSLLEREELVEADTLDGGEVLPGFSCRVAEIFE